MFGAEISDLLALGTGTVSTEEQLTLTAGTWECVFTQGCVELVSRSGEEKRASGFGRQELKGLQNSKPRW